MSGRRGRWWRVIEMDIEQEMVFVVWVSLLELVGNAPDLPCEERQDSSECA